MRVICEFMGGGFGSKTGVDSYLLLAAELARRTGRPVRCALTRREENMVSGNRNATIQRRDGRRAAPTARSTALGGEYTCALGWDGWLPPTAGPMQLLYACENVRTVEHGAKLNLPPMAAFRAPGFVEGTWSLECLLDELAAQLGVDPLELRKRNYAHADAMDGRPYSSKSLMECYRRAEPHWERRHEVRARSDEIWKRGMGMASQIWYGGGGPPSYAWVRLGSDGRANVVTAMQDIGTGTRTAMAMIAAEELGLPLDQVEVQLGDSARGPFAVDLGRLLDDAVDGPGRALGRRRRGAAGDRDRGAAVRARGAAALAEGRPDRLVGRRLVAARGDHRPARATARSSARAPAARTRRACACSRSASRSPRSRSTSRPARCVVEKVVAIHDVGRVINPLGARSQIEGGIIQALGHTFSEVRLDDPQTGTILTRTLDSYKMPTIADVPEIVCDLVDEPDEHLTNLGSKGLGEPPIVPTAAAIANAIRDATGADVTSLPITREEILRALRDAEAARRKEPVAAGAA